MAVDSIDALRERNEIQPDGRGGLRFQGSAQRLHRWLDGQIERLVLDGGAAPFAGVDTIDRKVLATAAYFESFAEGAIPASPDGAICFAPAACYQVYPALRGTHLEAGQIFGVNACCGRNEQRRDGDLGRLRRFHMREAVFLGPPAWVAAQRDEWMNRVTSFAAMLGLDTAVEPATDTFFGSQGRGRRLMQQLKNLKYELRADAGSAGHLAIASFNLHESFFASRFAIGPMADGSPAVTGCVAFGIERWTLACLARHGTADAAARAARLARQ
jgi:hypothetical protein